MADWNIRKGDTRPALLATLMEGDSPANLDGCTVQWRMHIPNSELPTIVRDCVIIDPLIGKVQMLPAKGDTDVAGNYLGLFTVTYPDTTKTTFPMTGYVSVQIHNSDF